MNDFLNAIEKWFKELVAGCARAETINTEEDYRRVKAWVKKVLILYGSFTALFIPIMVIFARFPEILDGEPVLIAIIPIFLLIALWGYATIILYLPRMFRGMIDFGRFGFEVGKNVKSTHVEVKHEFGDTYKVSTYTDNKGCLFAIIGAGIRFFAGIFFCVYIGSFATFKKIYDSIRNLRAFRAEH